MGIRRVLLFSVAACLLAAGPLSLLGCSSKEEQKPRVLTIGAYTTPREVYGNAIIPAFVKHWNTKTGQTLEVHESYQGSGAQARSIIGGFEADVAALSLEEDIQKITRAGLITGDWKAGTHGGMVTRSVVVICVRKGNPKKIMDWADLARPDVEVLTPNPQTSGGAMWNISALYGAAFRGHAGVPANDPKAAEGLLKAVLARVSIMDSGARESMITFEKGVGDAAITYENEVLVGRKAGRDYEYVIPSSTILIENPAAIVDKYAKAHGNEDLAGAFAQYLTGPEAQRAYAQHGLRPVDPAIAKEVEAQFPAPKDLFTIRDLGGWPKVTAELFSAGGVFPRLAAARGGR